MQEMALQKNGYKLPGPLLLIILDGVGLYRGKSEGYPGNALDLADAPVIKNILKHSSIFTKLRAHGTAVGMPSDDDMGNSEVGHNAMGAGRIFDQGAKLVSEAIRNGLLFRGASWMQLIGSPESPGLALEEGKERAVHFIGLLSDGNVHSHIDHLIAMVEECAKRGVKRVFVHALLDGRDVSEQSALIYVERLEGVLRNIDPTGHNYAIASGGGRMKITMDRYEADWGMVELGWKTHVAGDGRLFSSAREAIEAMRVETPRIIDQDLPPFVIAREGRALGPIQNDDIVILYNFRGDRAIEISRAFTEREFTRFKRIPEVSVHFSGIMEYDGDLKIPPVYLINPPAIDRTVSEYLAKNGINQFAISETQKFGHVTYFWNGNNSEKFDQRLETYVQIPSDRISFDRAPEMKANEITDALIEALNSGKYDFLRVNYANGDMVGHTGSLDASVRAVEALDGCVGRLLNEARKINANVIITADHGNCDQMIETDAKGDPKKGPDGRFISKTSHTLNPVPFVLIGPAEQDFKLNPEAKSPGLGNIASTLLSLLGFEPPEGYLPSIVTRKG